MADLGAASVTCEPITVRVVSNLLQTSHTPERLVAHCSAIAAAPREFPRPVEVHPRLPEARRRMPSNASRSTCRSTAPTAPSRPRTACTSPRTSTRCATSSRRRRATARRSTTRSCAVPRLGAQARVQARAHLGRSRRRRGDERFFRLRRPAAKPMKREKLREWYTAMLTKANGEGPRPHRRLDVGDLRRQSIAEIPLFHGDQWEITVPR